MQGATKPTTWPTATPAPTPWNMVEVVQLAGIIRGSSAKVLVIDSRSFLEYNTRHVTEAINVCCSKLVKRRLQQDKITVRDLLAQTCHVDTPSETTVIVYDQCTTNPTLLAADCFLVVLLRKLTAVFSRVALLKGGFLEFQASHPSLCESQSSTDGGVAGNYKCPPLTSMSQPCMPVSNVGPTRILPFLYLGSQHDALSQETMNTNGITYVVNVSTTCKQPSFIPDEHFLRVPVNDNYADKLLPHFTSAFQFLDKVREASGCVLVHCLAGISRSPTLAIAYIMQGLGLSTDEAYKYVKDKRPTISPNFNFLGQLLEWEKQLRGNNSACDVSQSQNKKPCLQELRSPTMTTATGAALCGFNLHLKSQMDTTPGAVQSPSAALARLTFASALPSPIIENTPASIPPPIPAPSATTKPDAIFPHFPTTSLDKLSFTPCFAKEDSTRLIRPGSAKSGGTKRPLSTSALPLRNADTSTHQRTSRTDTVTSQADTCVTMRSPELRAKRPLVRPNSIAFSTYPRFDFSTESSTGTASSTGNAGSRSSATTEQRHRSPSMDDSVGSQAAQSPGSESSHSVRFVEGLPVEMRPKDPGLAPPTEHRSSLEQARKSRSLEDILNSPDTELGDCGCSVGPRRHRPRQMCVAELLATPVALDRVSCRCRGPADPHQSSSSISSSGSHNSLHGSLEIIQVS